MSIAVMTGVWQHSQQRGNALLLLLAIADFANDEGVAYPAVSTLAKKSRMSERQTQRVLGGLIKSTELKIRKNAGPKGTHLYQVVVNPTVTADLFDEQRKDGGVNLSPRQLDGVTKGPEGVTSRAKSGDTAMSPEPSGTINRTVSSDRAKPGPVSEAFKVYSDAIKAKYGGEYPPSAKANGQLANVVARVGREHAVDVVRWYLGQGGFYGKVKHSLDYLVRDCEQLYLAMQAAAGGSAAPAPKVCEVALLKESGELARRLQDYPVGDALATAKKAVAEYSRMIAAIKPKYVSVRTGAQSQRFSLEELAA